jgi:hypothetical protein
MAALGAQAMLLAAPRASLLVLPAPALLSPDASGCNRQ